MITEYICVDDKVVATDDNKGLVKLDYQDNIGEVLSQKNIIEELEKHINDLVTTKKNLNNPKTFLKENLRFFIQIDSVFAIGLACMYHINPDKLFEAIIPFLVACSATTYAGYKACKRERKLKVEAVEQEIREFGKTLKKEKQKLKELESEKKVEQRVSEDINYVDNRKLTDIERRKKAYMIFRDNCLKPMNEIIKENLKDKLIRDGVKADDDLIDNVKQISDSVALGLRAGK